MGAVSRVYLCRHGDALAPGEPDDQLFSVGNHRLSPRGVRQAVALRDALAAVDVDAVYASPLERTLHTAEVVAAPHGVKVEVEPRLVELGFTDHGEELDYGDVLAAIHAFGVALAQGESPTLPSGETYEDVQRRLRAAVHDATTDHERAVLVAHGAANRVLLADLLGVDAAHLFRIEQDPACLNVLERRRDQWRLLLLNHTPWRPLS